MGVATIDEVVRRASARAVAAPARTRQRRRQRDARQVAARSRALARMRGGLRRIARPQRDRVARAPR